MTAWYKATSTVIGQCCASDSLTALVHIIHMDSNFVRREEILEDDTCALNSDVETFNLTVYYYIEACL